MYKKIILSLALVVTMIIEGAAYNNSGMVKESKQEENLLNEVNLEIAKNENKDENPNDIENQNLSSEEIGPKEDTTITADKVVNDEGEKNAKSNSKKQGEPANNNNTTQGNTSNKSNQESNNTKVEDKKSQSNVPATPTKEDTTPKVEPEPIKETTTYNSSKTLSFINDIDTLAKSNTNLWGPNGEKRYKVEVSSSITNGNYMYPYSIGQLKGVVLNVYPVKFLVYVVDYSKTGLKTETRYYIKTEKF